jgi:molybdate transport system permease protein
VDAVAFALSFKLSLWTACLLAPLGVLIARALAFQVRRGRAVLEGLIALPLVLPPTVLGFYLLSALGEASPLGRLWSAVFGQGLVFSFEGLVAASLVANLPFAVQPALRAFEAIRPELREAAWVSGLGPWRTFWTVEAPLAWPGVLTGFILTFAHTMGEFGVVLMIGGSIPGETRTAALAIYDRVQAFDDSGAGVLAAALVAVSVAAIIAVQALGSRLARHDR